MIKVNVLSEENSWAKKITKSEELFNKVCKNFPKKFKFINKKVYLTLLLSNNQKIKILNKKFRKKNKSTDVLSFPYNTKKKFRELKNTKLEIYLGDIIINFRKINASSKILFKKKFDELWIHGLVHLFGYDHIKDSNFKKMNYIEKKFLKKIN